MTEIAVTAEASPLSPMADTLGRSEIINREAVTVAAAIDYIPGVALDRSAGRNEVGIRIRGFSNMGQIPLYLDGIPIYIPYDLNTFEPDKRLLSPLTLPLSFVTEKRASVSSFMLLHKSDFGATSERVLP